MNASITKKGFTLLELLIVISIIAILSVILIVALNPAETLKKARDTQRISDLAALKTAIGIYTTTESPVYLAGAASNAACQVGTNGWTGETATGLIYYSIDAITQNITDDELDGTTFTSDGNSQVATAAEVGEVDGTGWVPVNFGAITGGSPISNGPIDPTNTVADVADIDANDMVYRYACNDDNSTFEVNAQLESTSFTVDDNKRIKDGGNSVLMYEVGSNLSILGANNTTGGTVGF